MRLGEEKKIRGATPEQEEREAEKLSVAAHLSREASSEPGRSQMRMPWKSPWQWRLPWHSWQSFV